MNRYPWVLGFTWPAGSPYFITNAEKRVVELEDAYILIHQKKLYSLQPLLPILEAIVQAGKPRSRSEIGSKIKTRDARAGKRR